MHTFYTRAVRFSSCLILPLLFAGATRLQAQSLTITSSPAATQVCPGQEYTYTASLPASVPGSEVSGWSWEITPGTAATTTPRGGLGPISSSSISIGIRWNGLTGPAVVKLNVGTRSGTLLVGTLSGITPLAAPVPSPASAIIIGANASYCISRTNSFSVSSPQNGLVYEWFFPNGGAQVVSTSGQGRQARIQWTATASGTVTVAVKVRNTAGAACSSLFSELPRVSYPLTASPVVAAGLQISGPQTVCAGGAYTYAVAGGIDNATNYQWTAPAGSSVAPGADGRSATVTFGNTAGSVTVRGSNACGTSTVLALPVRMTAPITNAGVVQGPSSVCRNRSYTYTVPVVAEATYQWVVPPGATIESGQNTPSLRLRFGEAAFAPDGTGRPAPEQVQVRVANTCTPVPVGSAPLQVRLRDPLATVRQVFSDGDLRQSVDPLFTGPRTKDLTLNTCDQVDVNLCGGRIIRQATLKAVLDTRFQQDIHTLPTNIPDYPTTLTFNVTGLNEAGQPVLSRRNIRLRVDRDQPEQVFVLDFTALHSQLVSFVVQPATYTGPSDAAIAAKIAFRVSYEETFQYGGASLVATPRAMQPDPGSYEQVFQWTSNCPAVTQYQLQLLRIYQQAQPAGNGPNEAPDWSKALTLEVEARPQPGSGVFSQVLALAEGSGDYRWRVRAVGTAPGGMANPLNWGAWSAEQIIDDYVQPDQAAGRPGSNWIYSRTFTEGGRVSERMSFANGLGQIAQSQTKIQSQNQVVVAETKQDYVGRDALQTLPVPIAGKTRLGYLAGMLRDNLGNVYVKDKFDSDERYKSPAPAREGGYYSGLDLTDGTEIINEGVADAEGYPYTRTLYAADGTGRVKEQGGVGKTHRLDSTHTVRTAYSGVSEDEIVKLFGEEAPRAANVHKTITTDPNGTQSVTYQTKDGKTIATALMAGTGGAALDKLPSHDAQLKQITETITEKTPFNGIGNSSRKPLVLTQPTNVRFTYSITPETLAGLCRDQCTTCDYQVVIRVVNQDDPSAVVQVGKPILIPAGGCPSGQPQVAGRADTTLPLGAGSYVIEKMVTAHNRAAGTGETYLERQLAEMAARYSEDNLLVSDDWKQIRRHLAANQAEELYQFLRQKGYTLSGSAQDGGQPYYEVPLLVAADCEEIKIHIPVVEKVCRTCDFPDNDPAQGFEAYFASKQTGKTLAGVIDPAGTTGWQPGEVNAMARRMVADGYPCEQLWGCWQQTVDQYAESLVRNSADPRPAYSIPNVPSDLGAQYAAGNYRYNLLDEFIACTGAVKTGYHSNLPWTAENRLSAYKTFYVDAARLADPQDVAALCRRHLDAASALDASAAEYRHRFDTFKACLETGVKATPEEAAAVADRLKQAVLQSIGNTCAARRAEYRQQLVAFIHTVEQKLIEGIDTLELTEDAAVQFTHGGVTRPLLISAGSPLPAGFVFTAANSYQSCQLEAMADAMVIHCQKGLSPEMVALAGQDTPAGRAAYRKIENILLHGFEVQVGGSCGSGFDLIDPANPGGGGPGGAEPLLPVPFAVTQTGPAGVGNAQTNMAWLDASVLGPLANGQGVGTWTDRSGNNQSALQGVENQKPQFFSNAVNGKAVLRFDGYDSRDTYQETDNMELPLLGIKNNFTIFSVAKPTIQHEIDPESNNPTTSTGVSNQKYLLFPQHGAALGSNEANAGSGLSVGTNGVSVYEHSGNYMPPLAVYNGAVAGFSSITMQYAAKRPSIYLNNQLVRAGLQSLRSGDVFASTYIGGSLGYNPSTPGPNQYGDFQGDVAEMIWYNHTLSNTQRTIIENYLAAKYNLTIAGDFYTTHAPAHHLDVQGIGTVDGTDKHVQAANGKGLILSEAKNSLDAANEFVFAGHGTAANAEAATEIPADMAGRWQRDWYIQKTGAADVQLTFDFVAAGMTVPADLGTVAARYRLLYRPTPTQPFSVVPVPVVLNDNNRLSFVLDNARLANGYYTLGITEEAPQVGDLSGALVAYWRFEEQQGTFVKDVSCNGHDGVVTYENSWTPNGKINGAFTNPPAGEGIFTTSTPLNWTPTSFSVGFWMNPSVLLTYGYVIGSGFGPFLFHIDDAGRIYVGTDIQTRLYLPPGTVKANEWQHFVFTFDNGNAKLYRNSQLIDSKTGMTMPQMWGVFMMGHQPYYNNLNPGITGKLDEVQIFNRALTGPEVASVAGATRPLVLAACPNPACRPAPKLCFRYNELSMAADSVRKPDGLDEVYVLKPVAADCGAIRMEPVRAALRSQLAAHAERRLAAHRDRYQAVCVAQEGLVENFTISYGLARHHYTLYYYDRAGRLTATVPPEGVDKDFLNAGTRAARPAHRLKTTYAYNSLGQLVRQHTPDGGATDFHYNNKSQLRFSRNDRQGNATGSGNDSKRWFSYTKYDKLGRVVEVGESSLTDELRGKIEDMAFPAAGLRQVTQTTYTAQAADAGYPLANAAGVTGAQRFLQNRVSYTRLDPDPNVSGDEQATYYSYDAHGNVEWLAQEIPGLGRKYVRYEYDLISGKVLRVSYQENTPEQFHHRYSYDEDNRLTAVETSTDGTVWDRDASYQYHRHGPLQRMGLGQDRLQGVDYTYTIHGWLKAINGGAAPPAPGGGAGAVAPADAFRMALTYYSGDYRRAGAGGVEPVLDMAPAAGRDLFNGNIAAWSRQVAPRPGGAGGLSFDGQVTGERFTYDELNRLKGSTFQALTGPAAAAGAYATTYGYDPNGNLLTLTRNDRQGRAIDNLTYRYNRDAAGGLADNKLRGVGDGSGQALGVAHQTAQDNYTYDETGNLIADAQDRIRIEWTLYGKVKSVTRTDGSQTISYLYDASGNRTVKTVRTVNLQTNVATMANTYYVRDAQGNVLAVYDDNNGTGTLRQSEVYLYGSSRLGVFRPNGNRSVATNGIYTRRLQQKEYELTDHLGNVRAVIGDYRQSESGGIRAALKSYFNHYAFGLEMPGMNWKGGNGYRYGYNGKEQDADFANNYDYGFRIYDEASCRFLSVDPLSSSYPMLTPYQFASNNPIMGIDQDGLEFAWAQELWDKTTSGYNTAVKVIDETYTRASPYVNAAGRGLKSTANNLALYRPLTPEESKQIDDDGGTMGSLKKWPGRTWDGITSLPGNLKKIYAEGTAEQQIETTVAMVGIIAAMAKGKTKMPTVAQAGLKLPKISLAFSDWLKKGPHAYSELGKSKELRFYLDDAGKIAVKATGENLSKKDIEFMLKEGANALQNAEFREDLIKKIDGSLTLPDAKKFTHGADKLNKFKEALNNYEKN